MVNSQLSLVICVLSAAFVLLPAGRPVRFRNAGKVRGIVGVACALILRNLTERAQGTRLIDLAVGQVRRDDLGGFLTLLDPFLNYLHLIECIGAEDRKSTRLNSSHLVISYAVFCL